MPATWIAEPRSRGQEYADSGILVFPGQFPAHPGVFVSFAWSYVVIVPASQIVSQEWA